MAEPDLSQITPALRAYITETIFPEYTKNDYGHQLDHITYVIRRSLDFAAPIPDLNLDIVYTVAAYHDIGHHIDAAHHEKVSSQIFQQDDVVKQFFTPAEQKLIVEAIEDHRSSSDHTPRSIYGKIVATADCNIDVDVMLRRTYSYRVRNFRELTLEEIIEESRKHLINKYGEHGYACTKRYFPDPEFDRALKELRQLTSDAVKFRERFLAVNGL